MDDLSSLLRPRPRRMWMPLGAAALSLTLAAWLGTLAYQEHEEAMLTARRVERARTARAVRPPPKLRPGEQEEQKRWAALNAERAFAWAPVFAAVERAASPEVELLEFQPEKEQRRISLQGEARNREALTAFLQALARQPVFRNVHLRHQEKRTRDRLETVQFEISAAIAE